MIGDDACSTFVELLKRILDIVSDIEKEVKKDALEKGLKGDIKIYLNINEKAAYYTVDGEGASEYKIDLTALG